MCLLTKCSIVQRRRTTDKYHSFDRLNHTFSNKTNISSILWAYLCGMETVHNIFISMIFHKLRQYSCLPRIRSSRQEVFCKKGIFKNFANSQENTCVRVHSLRPATLLKRRLWHSCFPANFAKFLRTPFLVEHLWLLLLSIKFVNSWSKNTCYRCNEITTLVFAIKAS